MLVTQTKQHLKYDELCESGQTNQTVYRPLAVMCCTYLCICVCMLLCRNLLCLMHFMSRPPLCKCQSLHSGEGVLCSSELLWLFLYLADTPIWFHTQALESISCNRSYCGDKLGIGLWQMR